MSRRIRTYRCHNCRAWQAVGPRQLCPDCRTKAQGGPPILRICERCGNWRRVGEACEYCRNQGGRREFEAELEQAAEQMSQSQRSGWGQVAHTVGTEIAKQQLLPDGTPDEIVDNLIEQARLLYDMRHVALLPLRMTLYTLIGRGMPPLQALQISAHRLRLPPLRQGPGSRGRITREQVRAMERRMLQRGLRPGRAPRLRRQRETEFESALAQAAQAIGE